MPDCIGCGFCCLTKNCPLRAKPPAPGEPCASLLWDSRKLRFTCAQAAERGALLHIGVGCGIPTNPSRILMEHICADMKKGGPRA